MPRSRWERNQPLLFPAVPVRPSPDDGAAAAKVSVGQGRASEPPVGPAAPPTPAPADPIIAPGPADAHEHGSTGPLDASADRAGTSSGNGGLFDPASAERPVPPVAVPDDGPVPTGSEAAPTSGGLKGRGRDVLAAVRTLKAVERDGRPATPEQRWALARLGGLGPLALSIFPDPATGAYKGDAWRSLGEQLRAALSDEEYASARRTTFSAFYTPPAVVAAVHAAGARLGVPPGATVLEPGCGTGRFIGHDPAAGYHFVGVEQDLLSGRIAKALHPGHDVRVENFRDTRLPAGSVDAAVGNVPFADVTMDHGGHRFPVHDYFLAKSVDALRPRGVLALVTSRFTLDKRDGAARQYLGDRADFVGAIRLPSNAFVGEGTDVVADVIFLRKRAAGEPPQHVDPDWLSAEPTAVDGVEVPVNRYFLNHPEMVLGRMIGERGRFGTGTMSVRDGGDLAADLAAAVARLPAFPPFEPTPRTAASPPPEEQHRGEGSFHVGDDGRIYQTVDGRAVPVVYGGTGLSANGTLVGRRMAALIGLRDRRPAGPAVAERGRAARGPGRRPS